MSAGIVGKTSGEGFIEPEVVPPLHGHEVSKPHVAELVLDHSHVPGHQRNRQVFGSKTAVVVGDTAHIFHGTILVVGAKHVVNLGERISLTVAFLEEVYSCFCDSKHELIAKVLSQ